MGKHVFRNALFNDPDVILVPKARLAFKDGSSKYFDPVSKEISTIKVEDFVK